MSTADLPEPIYLGLKWNHHQLYTADELRAYGDKRTREAVEALPGPDMVPPATHRDRWMFRQGWLGALDPRSHPDGLPATLATLAAASVEQAKAELIEELCARIKAADDAAADGDYMLDSDDCIAVLRGTWQGPMANDMPPAPASLAASPSPDMLEKR